MWKAYFQATNLIYRNQFTTVLNYKNLTKCSILFGKSSSVNRLVFNRGIATREEILSTSLKQPLNQKSNTQTNKPPGNQGAPTEKPSNLKKFLGIFASGAVTYFALSYYLDLRKGDKSDGINYSSANLPGKVVPSKSIIREKNPGNIKLTLYQYATCPFCCKVRAYLDYFGYTYDIVEVNSITKKQLDWSSYKKVPQVAIQIPSATNPEEYDDQIIQLNDSSVIVSALETYRLDPSTPLKQVALYYEPVKIDYGNDKTDNTTNDYINKYFVMLHSDKVNDGKSLNERKEEREWRGWVDSKFIHVISPNVYRTFGEALETFNYFNSVGEWEKNFNQFERLAVIYIGTIVMYLLSISLKRKYNLKDDVRESMYDLCNEWASTIDSRQQFRGGFRPNLSDLSLYGAIQSFEGCDAFKDMIANSKIKNWYDGMKEQVVHSKGSVYLNNPFSTVKHSMDNCNEVKNQEKKKKKFYIF